MSMTVTLSPRMERQARTVYETSVKRDAIEDIRKNVPEVSNLLKWWGRLRAHEDQEARRKRSRNKGKEVVRGEVQILSLQPDANRAIPLDRTPTGTGPVLDREGRLSEASAFEGGQTGSGVFGLELPRPPPPVRDAPLPPSQPAELPSSSTVPVPPPPVRAPPVVPQPLAELPSTAGTIPVRVQLSKLQRLQEFELRSSTALTAREIRLSKPQIEKLRTFSEFVGTPNQMTLFGRQLPQCHRYVVEIERKAGWETYICIEGLKKEEDIRDFYAVMSQRKYRKYSEPWKICFRMADVSSCAAARSDLQEVDAMCQISLKSTALLFTLCNSLVRVKGEHGERVSTIGGIIQIGSELFALTAAHSPTLGHNNTASVPATSITSTLQDEDFPDDLEKPLVLFEDCVLQAGDLAAKFDFSTVAEINTPKIYENQKDDWCLIPVAEPKYQLPNAHLFSPGYFSHFNIAEISRPYSSSSDPGGLRVSRARVAEDDELQPGKMACAPSFLDGLYGPIEVWAVMHKVGDRRGIDRGTSGSWFIDVENGEPVGTLVARSSHGKTFITLLSRQLESISDFFSSENSPMLPPPEPMLLRAAKNYHTIDRKASDGFVQRLFNFVRAPDTPYSVIKLTLQKALATMSVPKLKILITISGSDLESTLKRVLGEEELDPIQTSSALKELASIYQRVEQELSDSDGPPVFVGPSERLPTPPQYVHWLEPPSRPRSPMMTTGRQEDPNRMNGRTTPRVRLHRKVPAAAAAAWAALYFLVIAGYLAGIGVGAWKLLDSGLSLQVKIGVGVSLIIFHLVGSAGVLVMRLYFTRKRH